MLLLITYQGSTWICFFLQINCTGLSKIILSRFLGPRSGPEIILKHKINQCTVCVGGKYFFCLLQMSCLTLVKFRAGTELQNSLAVGQCKIAQIAQSGTQYRVLSIWSHGAGLVSQVPCLGVVGIKKILSN